MINMSGWGGWVGWVGSSRGSGRVGSKEWVAVWVGSGRVRWQMGRVGSGHKIWTHAHLCATVALNGQWYLQSRTICILWMHCAQFFLICFNHPLQMHTVIDESFGILKGLKPFNVSFISRK